MSERCCIFGRSGFIGSHLAELLAHSGHDVVGGDRDGNVPPEVGHIVDSQSFGNYHWQTDRQEIWKANVGNLINMLEQCGGVRGFLYLSSSSVLLEKQTDYSRAKRAGEEVCRQFAQEKPVVIVRPSTVTGPGEQPTRLIPKLIESCLTGKEIPFVAEPTHDFIDVRDFVTAAQMLLFLAQTEWGRAFNVSSGKTVSNEEVLAIVEARIGRKANVKRVEKLRDYDTKNWAVDNSPILGLGWRPKYTL